MTETPRNDTPLRNTHPLTVLNQSDRSCDRSEGINRASVPSLETVAGQRESDDSGSRHFRSGRMMPIE